MKISGCVFHSKRIMLYNDCQFEAMYRDYYIKVQYNEEYKGFDAIVINVKKATQEEDETFFVDTIEEAIHQILLGLGLTRGLLKRKPKATRRKATIEKFHKDVLGLSNKRGYHEAYDLAERLHKRRYGSRRYKNYDSYRNAISIHHKKKKE